jgi:ubiquinone/menaquinone biosynthesis C-methylase UbiE
MVEKYNEAARMQGLSKQQMYAIKGDLQSPMAELNYPDLHGEDFFGFHTIIMSMGLHHIHNPQEMLMKLVERLKDSGVVIIIDWVSQHEKLDQHSISKKSHDVDPRSHSDKHGHHSALHSIAHAGFSEDQMHRMLKKAGCSDVDYVLLPEPSRVPSEIGGQKQLFFARGRKGAQQTS